jgi:hypothetical protein
MTDAESKRLVTATRAKGDHLASRKRSVAGVSFTPFPRIHPGNVGLHSLWWRWSG